MNPNPLNQCSRPENIAHIWIDSENSWALLDSGSTINAVTPEFIQVHSLDIGPLSDLSNSTMGINGFRGEFSWPLGYVIIRVQDGLQQRSSSPSHTKLYWLWIPSTSYSGYTHHQMDH